MKFTESKIHGCFVIECNEFKDQRGSFTKIFNDSAFQKAGIEFVAKESFYSISRKNSLRGMHYQKAPHQIAKIIYCSHGEILDVFLDLRKTSPSYGKFDCITLSKKNSKAVFLPEGVAHGFLTISSKSIVSYLQSAEYNQESDSGILWNSFGMNWGITDPIISNRDKNFVKFSEL